MDSIDHDGGRRDFLKCMAWAGTGALFTLSGGVASSIGLDGALAAAPALGSFHFLRYAANASSHALLPAVPPL